MTTVRELIRLLRSPDNAVVLKAIEQLRIAGWLQDGTLLNVPLCHVHMENADLSDANLTKVDFHQAHLQRANLSKTNLNSVKLTRANLVGAVMEDADLHNADLYKANLTGVIGLHTAQLSQARRLFGATMPDGKPYDGRFNLEGDLEFARWGRVDVDDAEAMAEFFGVPLEIYLKGQEELLPET